VVSVATENEHLGTTTAIDGFAAETAGMDFAVPDENQTIEGAPQAPAAAAEGEADAGIWTAEEVAEQFAAIFGAAEFGLPFLREGSTEHWNIPSDRLLKLGEKWKPIFDRYVSKDGAMPQWMRDAMMWAGALGGLYLTVREPLAVELKLIKEQQKKNAQKAQQSGEEKLPDGAEKYTTENMQTETSGA